MRLFQPWIAVVGALGVVCAGASVTKAADAASSTSTSTTVTLRSGLDLAGFDRSVRPQDDLYRFAGGTWLATTEIPADRSNYGTFSKLEDDAIAALRALAEAAVADAQKALGSDRQKLGDLYAAYMDEQGIEQRGLAPLKDELARIDSINDARAIFEYIGRAQRIGGGAHIGFYVGQDRKNSSSYIAGIGQSGLTMPDREYYLADDERNRKFREAFVRYAEQLLSLSGAPDAAAKASRVLAIETAIAQQHWTRVENRDPLKTYNKTTIKELASLAPALDWNAFVAGLGVDPAKIQAVDVRQPSYLREASRLVRELPVEDWRAYFRFRLLDGSAAFLPSAFDAARFEFRERTLRGVQ
jgi:predicted metalloendopeptidase